MNHEDAETLYINVRRLLMRPTGYGNAAPWIPLLPEDRLPAGPARDALERAFAILEPTRCWPRSRDHNQRLEAAQRLYSEALNC
jgi:hypothetical protein